MHFCICVAGSSLSLNLPSSVIVQFSRYVAVRRCRSETAVFYSTKIAAASDSFTSITSKQVFVNTFLANIRGFFKNRHIAQ